jgi:hypothetical protein
MVEIKEFCWLCFYVMITLFVGLCNGRAVTLGVIVPFSGSRSFGKELQVVTMELALKKVCEVKHNVCYLFYV